MRAIIVHGGAWDIPDDLIEDHKVGMSVALDAGHSVLSDGGSSLDAVQAAVERMEEECIFDAGCGSFLNQAGDVEMDSAIMRGKDLALGSVAGIRNVRHPVRVARQVMERTGHCLLVGQGATEFARSLGEELIPSHELVSPRELQRWKENQQNGFDPRSAFEANGKKPSDTVGAIAIDDNGDIAVATSTGGTPGKMVGRVGDSPLVGSGIYADNASGGVASTGYGEAIMKVCLARRVCEGIEAGMDPKTAAHTAIDHMFNRTGGRGGVIVLDKKGRLAWHFNTPRMAFGYVDMYAHKAIFVANRDY